jgi:hypothetical protein
LSDKSKQIEKEKEALSEKKRQAPKIIHAEPIFGLLQAIHDRLPKYEPQIQRDIIRQIIHSITILSPHRAKILYYTGDRLKESFETLSEEIGGDGKQIKNEMKKAKGQKALGSFFCAQNPNSGRIESSYVFSKFGEGGIRTLDTGINPYNGLANRRLQPTRPPLHISARCR